MTRKPIMAGNQKMNLNHVEVTGLIQKLVWTLVDKEYDGSPVDCVVIPSFIDLRTVQALTEGDRFPIQPGAQDVSEYDSGAYTGEVGAGMLSKLGVRYMVVGHSECREYHGETGALINAKALKVLAVDMIPIICCGEGLNIRKEGRHAEYTLEQVRGCLKGIPAEQVASLVIACEPVWTVGAGEVATPEGAQEVCGAIREEIAKLHDRATADATRVQYGGSVKASSVAEIMAQSDVDGALVGGVSLKAEEFAAIVLFS